MRVPARAGALNQQRVDTTAETVFQRIALLGRQSRVVHVDQNGLAAQESGR